MTARNLSLEVTVECVSGRSPEDCITKTKSGQADLVTLDGGNVYEGGKRRILAFEFHGQLDGSHNSYFLTVVRLAPWTFFAKLSRSVSQSLFARLRKS